MNIFGWGKGKVPINPKFQEMSHDELLLTAKTIKEANDNLKETLNAVTEENTNLKNSIVNKKKNSSDLKDIYKTLFLSNETNVNEKNKEFNDFLYDQYLLYDGLEEEDINDLNQIKVKEDNWSDNKDLFVFKQKIIERNYQKLFRNIAASKELQNLYGIKEDLTNDNSMDNSTEENNNKNDIIHKENENKEEEKENTDELVTLSDKIDGNKKKKKNKKKNNKEKEKENEKEKKKEKERPEKKESNKFNQGNLNPINNLKKDSINLDNLLDDESNDNEGLSFKDLSNKNNGWEEE